MTSQFFDAAMMFYGVDKQAQIAAQVCVACSRPATEFRSELDQREYHISGLCQHCQDEVFNSENT